MRWYLSLEANCELNYTPKMYFGYLPHCKETVESSTLNHWSDLSAKAKVWNPKFCIQCGIMQA